MACRLPATFSLFHPCGTSPLGPAASSSVTPINRKSSLPIRLEMDKTSRTGAAIPIFFPVAPLPQLFGGSTMPLPESLTRPIAAPYTYPATPTYRPRQQNENGHAHRRRRMVDQPSTVSPDGRWLALYGRANKDGDTGLILIPTAGGAQSHGISWTPDSKRLLFDGTDASTEIWSLHNLPR